MPDPDLAAAPPLPRLDGRTILQILPALRSGGVERGTVDIAGAIAAAGGRALVASAGGGMVRELERMGVAHLTLSLATKSPLGILANARRLRALIHEERVDLVHARSRAPAWSARLACRWTGTPFVTTVHAPYPFGNPLKRHYNSVMVSGDRVITISDFVTAYVRDGYGIDPARIRTIPRGVDTARFAAEAVSAVRLMALTRQWRLPEDRQIVLMPGRLARWKGQSVLIDALAALGRRDIRCLIVGAEAGTARERAALDARIRALGLEDVVQIAETCEDMPAAYKLADVVVHASVEPEGFGRVVIEAMAMGRPVVASALGAPSEVIEEGRTGWLVQPGDPAALGTAIARALALTPAERAALGRAAAVAVEQRYTSAHMAAATLAVYRELLPGSDTAPAAGEAG